MTGFGAICFDCSRWVWISRNVVGQSPKWIKQESENGPLHSCPKKKQRTLKDIAVENARILLN